MDFIKEVEIIKQSRLASNAYILKKDVQGVSQFWLDDFLQIAGDGSYTVGKTQIIKDWRYMFKYSSPIFERLPIEIQISESGDKAWEKGRWQYTNEKFKGNYSATWHKIKGIWLTKCEHYVSLD
jgi:ketosteroid isomerase-like protein